MTKAEITRKLDEIIDFSGCERYIDTPVKRYSSGMRVRLGFAVAAHLDPDILVVDEVLAVGDAEFQKKAIGKMQDVSQGEGRTILFVSHNMTSIRRLCKNGVLLDNGLIKTTGKIEDVIDMYKRDYEDIPLTNYAQQEPNPKKEHQVIEMKLVNQNGDLIKPTLETTDEAYLYIKYHFKHKAVMHLTFIITTADDETILFNERTDYSDDYLHVEPGYYETIIKLPNPLLKPNTYYITANAFDRGTKVVEGIKNGISFEIIGTQMMRQISRPGNLYVPIEWDLKKL